MLQPAAQQKPSPPPATPARAPPLTEHTPRRGVLRPPAQGTADAFSSSSASVAVSAADKDAVSAADKDAAVPDRRQVKDRQHLDKM